MEWISRAWRGEEKCWKVFWVYGVFAGVIWSVLNWSLEGLFSSFPILQYVWIILRVVYNLWQFVSLYRCAFNLEWRFWGYIARGYTLFVPALVIIGLLIGGVLKGNGLIVEARLKSCERMEADAEYKSRQSAANLEWCKQHKAPKE
jgi:hypothetical protein